MKRTLWYVCFALLLAALGVAVLQAAGVTKEKIAGKTPATASTKHLIPNNLAKQASAVSTVDASVAEKETAWQLYDRMMNGEALTTAEKDLVYRYMENNPPSRGGRNALDNNGGPDAFGYRFKDNVAPDTANYNWIELRGDAGAAWISGWSSYDDGMSPAAYPIGFNFPFYGGSYTTFKASSNGQIEFGPSYSQYSYTSCLSASTTWGPAIMPYMYDMHLQRGGDATGNNVVGYENFGSYTVIEYDSTGYYSCTGASIKFEAILYSSGAVKLQYNNIAGLGTCSMPTVGIVSGICGPDGERHGDLYQRRTNHRSLPSQVSASGPGDCRSGNDRRAQSIPDGDPHLHHSADLAGGCGTVHPAGVVGSGGRSGSYERHRPGDHQRSELL